MKKKLLMAILPLCVALTMTACSSNADTAEVNGTTVTEENVDANDDAGAQAETQA